MSRAAIRYAKAILEIAQSNGTAEAVCADMKTIGQTITHNQELKDFLLNPTVKGDVKRGAITEIFKDVQHQTKGLFQLLETNKRFEILEAITTQYERLFDEMNGLENAVVTTAFSMTPEIETQVLSKIKEFTTKKITIQNVVDPAIIGGFIIRIGDKQFNASIASGLQQLRREFSN